MTVAPLAAARRLLAVLAVLAIVAVVASIGSPVAAAVQDGGSQISWSVSPSGPDGPDGRRVIDIELAPGASMDEHVLVRNHSDQTVTFDITANDGYLTASGKFDMRPRAHVPTEAGAWVQAVETLTLGAGDSAVVPVRLQVPADATPGDYSAGVAASVTSSADSIVATEHRVGVRVNIRVAGDLEPALALTALQARYNQSWNPFAPGSVTITTTVANTGNVRLRGELSASAAGWSGPAQAATAASPDLSPGAEAVVVTTSERVWPLGPVRTTVSVQPAGGTDDAALEPVVRSLTTWVVPVPQVALLLAALAAMVALRAAVRTRRRRLARMLAQAREAGMVEASLVHR